MSVYICMCLCACVRAQRDKNNNEMKLSTMKRYKCVSSSRTFNMPQKRIKAALLSGGGLKCVAAAAVAQIAATHRYNECGKRQATITNYYTRTY